MFRRQLVSWGSDLRTAFGRLGVAARKVTLVHARPLHRHSEGLHAVVGCSQMSPTTTSYRHVTDYQGNSTRSSNSHDNEGPSEHPHSNDVKEHSPDDPFDVATPSLRTAYPPSAVELPESTFLKCIEKEMMDEKLRLDKVEGPPSPPCGWEMHHSPGLSFFYGRRLWVPPAGEPAVTMDPAASDDDRLGVESCRPIKRSLERHFIRVQLTSRDASLDPECDVRGEHFPFSLFVQRVGPPHDVDGLNSLDTATQWRGDATDAYYIHQQQQQLLSEEEEATILQQSIEVQLDVVDSELVVKNVRFHGAYPIPAEAGSHTKTTPPVNGSTADAASAQVFYNNPFGGYPGPNLDEAEEEMLDGIQSWLAERQIDDRFGDFIGQYSVWVEQAEYECWLQQLYDYVAA